MSTTPTTNTISEVSIANMALARMGYVQQIASFQDDSPAAQQCSLFYPQDRDAMLCDFPWSWAEGYAQLDQVAGPEIDGEAASAQWLRSYRYPSDCLVMRRLMNTLPPISTGSIPQTTGTTINTYQNNPQLRPTGDPYPLSYGESSDATGRLVMTDFTGVGYGLTAVYTRAVNDPSQFTAAFADALAWRLAADIAMGLGFDDRRRQYLEAKYDAVIRKVRASDTNAANQDDIPWVRWQSQTVRARWGG